MKILSISHLYPAPNNEHSGIVIHQQMKEVMRLGCEVKVLCPKAWIPFPVYKISKKWGANRQIPKYGTLDGIEIFYPRYLVLPRALLYSYSGTRLYHSIKRLTDNIYKSFPFDIIHTHTASSDGYAAMLLARKYHKPLITTFRGTDIDITIHRSHRCFNAVQKVFENSSKIIAPSPRLKDTLYKQMKIESEVIGSGIYQKDIFRDVSALRKPLQGKFIILSVSRLVETKGIDLNIRAIAKLKKEYPLLHYLIIGEGTQKKKLEQLVEDLNLQGAVEFLGQLSHPKVMEYMSLCNIFSLPSWQETLGLVYLEAMAHSKPVIGCLGQGVDGIVTQNETGLLTEPKDINSLVQAMKYLLDNPQQVKVMGEKAKELVLNGYTWDVNGRKTVEVYNEALKHNA